jgi:hypothetical protein
MNPHERQKAQQEFRTSRQICVATEAAGEDINLQFCPWNPTRLEQRLGRIHRIGQERDVHAFNFVASESEEGQPIIEGRILERLLKTQVFILQTAELGLGDVSAAGYCSSILTMRRRLCSGLVVLWLEIDPLLCRVLDCFPAVQ